jgi:hydroxylamine reductase (hybrid-cluster protein)
MEIFVSKKSGKSVKVRNIYRAVCTDIEDAFAWAAMDAENLALENDKQYPFAVHYSFRDNEMDGLFCIKKRGNTQINIVVFEEQVDKDIYDKDELVIYIYKGTQVAMKNCTPVDSNEWDDARNND